MCANPFSAAASFRDTLAERECYFPPATAIGKTDNDGAIIEDELSAATSGLEGLGIHPELLERSPSSTKVFHFMTRSISDTALMSSTSLRNSLLKLCTPSNSPQATCSSVGEKESLSGVIESLADQSKKNKYESEYEATPELRSPRLPFKKLFGERGILVRPVGTKDIPDPRFIKTGFVHWSGKMKQRVEDMVSHAASTCQHSLTSTVEQRLHSEDT